MQLRNSVFLVLRKRYQALNKLIDLIEEKQFFTKCKTWIERTFNKQVDQI